MTVLDKILALLDSQQIKYKKVEHEPVYTSEEAAKIRGASLDKGAKAIVCFADEKPMLIVVPGNMKIDFRAFKKIFAVKDLKMATPEEVLNITGLTIGSIPPIGKALNLPSYFDERIIQKEEVAFNAGSHTVSLFMSAADLSAVEQPIIGNFALPKS